MNQDHDHDRIVSMQLTARMPFLPIVIQCVETAAGVFGLGREESLKLGLATEEIFSYLSERGCRGEIIDVRCMNGISYVRVELHFPLSELDMGSLNIASSVNCENEDNMAQMGLALASRSIDRLNIIAERKNRICLLIEKDKAYPTVPEAAVAPVEIRGALTVGTPDPEGVKLYVTRVAQGPPDPLRPSFFQYPGQVVDMVAAGDCQVLTVTDSRGECAGGLLFHYWKPTIVEVLGPHVFEQAREGEIEGMLLEDCIAKTARSKAIALLNLTGMSVSLQSQFEYLGFTKSYSHDGTVVEKPAFYRLLNEDPGCRIFTDMVLKDYLQREYDRLFLAREIQEIHDQGETKAGASIFSTDMLRERSLAILNPLWPGVDLDANVRRHIQFLRDEKINNIFFYIDLGVSWQASLIPILLDNNFRTAFVAPFAGQADLLVFQYDRTES
ncbi:MAG: hypothetical protein WC405_01020 [Syntrophales bacterium]